MKKMYWLLLLGLACESPGEPATDDKHTHNAAEPVAQQSSAKEMRQWKTYTNPDLNITLKYPPDWQVSERLPEGQMPVINIWPKNTAQQADQPVRIHAEPELSFVSILPEGYATELPFGKNKFLTEVVDLPVHFSLKRESSKIFMLENDSVWGYFLQPRDTISGWPDEAFIFAQAGTRNFRAECYESGSGQQKDLEKCDPLTGDEFRRYGQLKKDEKIQIIQILQSIRFTPS